MGDGTGSSDASLEVDWGHLSGWAVTKRSCPHTEKVGDDPNRLPMPDSSCVRCGEQLENWVCLSCCAVFCSRYVNGHMAAHSTQKGHPLALSFSDLSVWCFDCDSYIDAQLVKDLSPFFEIMHVKKFGMEAAKSLEGEMTIKAD